MRIRAHRLERNDGTPVPFLRSPNQGPGVITPQFLVMHFTAGRSAQSSIGHLTNPAAKASAHLVIGRDGSITQLVDFNKRAWHAGISHWDGRDNVNAFSIGIELDNAGELTGGAGHWRSWFQMPVGDADVLVARHKNGGGETGWQRYTEPQIGVAVEVGSALVRQYHLVDVVGHEDIAPGRKRDPGPAFPMSSFRSIAMGRVNDDPERYRTTASLNIRSGPGLEHGKLPQSPFPPGTMVNVRNWSRPWAEVEVLSGPGGSPDLTGWMHGDYLTRA